MATIAIPPAPPAIVEYSVTQGDTLWGIARSKLGDPLKWTALYDANKATIGPDPNRIEPGQRYTIPVPTGGTTDPPGAVSDTTSSDPGAIGGSDLVAQAKKYLGVPYVWGGTSPSGFDCSGFVQYVYGKLGFHLPRLSYDQAHAGRPVTDGKYQIGDLIFYTSNSHVAIYIGDGQIIEAPRPGKTVRIKPVDYDGQISAVRRLLPDAPADTASVADTTSGTSVDAAKAYAAAQLGPAQFQCLSAIIAHESGWNPSASNTGSGAYGLPQALPGSKMASAGSDWRTNPVTQIKWSVQYGNERYGSMCNAWDFWQAHRWW